MTDDVVSAGISSDAAGLTSWRDGPALRAILDFVGQVRGDAGSAPVPVEQRVAVFDNDGTLWCEKPMPIQLDFILRRFAEMAAADGTLRDRQPWKATVERDYPWFGKIMTDHYAGDDSQVKVLLGGILAAYAGVSVEDFEERSDTFLRTTSHPTLGLRYLQCGYRPMIELLGYLAANGFSNYIASGGGRDFMRPVTDEMYGVPRERVIGSSTTLGYDDTVPGGSITHLPAPDYLNDGAEKPIRIWSRIGRRPLAAGGNSNGDSQMLEFTGRPDLPALRLVVLHDDPDREFAYTSGAEQVLQRAASEAWTVVSMKDDWATVF